MNNMKVIPETKKYENVEGVRRISFCYLHGNLQDDAEYDIFGFLDFIADVPQDDDGGYYIQPGLIKDGIYPCEFEGKPCTFFYWNSNDKHGRHRGLVVYNDDADSYKYAEECYEKKAICL